MKTEKLLLVRMRYKEGIMTRGEWLQLKREQGATVTTEEVPKYVYSRSKFNQMDNKQQEEYETKLKETKQGYFLQEQHSGSRYDITKTEFDYFNSFGGKETNSTSLNYEQIFNDWFNKLDLVPSELFNKYDDILSEDSKEWIYSELPEEVKAHVNNKLSVILAQI